MLEKLIKVKKVSYSKKETFIVSHNASYLFLRLGPPLWCKCNDPWNVITLKFLLNVEGKCDLTRPTLKNIVGRLSRIKNLILCIVRKIQIRPEKNIWKSSCFFADALSINFTLVCY